MKALLWDMDGSLINTEPLWEIATYDVSEFLGRRLTPELRERCVGNTLRNTLTIAANHAGRTLDDALFAEASAYLEGRFSQLVRERGVQWRPGVPDILAEAKAENVPVVLVTNTRRHVAQPCIDAMGEEKFTATVCSDEVEHGKPAPDPYLRGAMLAGAKPGECLAIEDSATGVRSAVDAGCRVLWNPMPGLEPPADAVRKLSPPAMYVSGNLDSANLHFLRAAFASS